MIDRDLVIAKIDSIQRCLKRIEEKTKGQSENLKDLDVQDIFVLNLQRAIQTAIDLAAHVVSEKKLGVPKTLKENFELLRQAKILSSDLEQRLSKMVGFRNIAIHEYRVISEAVLASILKNHLQDLRDFMKVIANLLP